MSHANKDPHYQANVLIKINKSGLCVVDLREVILYASAFSGIKLELEVEDSVDFLDLNPVHGSAWYRYLLNCVMSGTHIHSSAHSGFTNT